MGFAFWLEVLEAKDMVLNKFRAEAELEGVPDILKTFTADLWYLVVCFVLTEYDQLTSNPIWRWELTSELFGRDGQWHGHPAYLRE